MRELGLHRILALPFERMLEPAEVSAQNSSLMNGVPHCLIHGIQLLA